MAMSRASGWAVGLALATGAMAQEEALSDKQQTFGASLVPAALPAGAIASYAFFGAPEIGGGYRQGFGVFELEGRARFDWFRIALAAEVVGKVPVYRGSALDVAPSFGFGLVYDTGQRYLAAANFQYFGLRLVAGGVASYKLAETLRAIAAAEIPLDITLNRVGGFRVTPLAGAGVELFLGEDFTAMALGQLGLDAYADPAGSPGGRLGFAVRVALGYRMF